MIKTYFLLRKLTGLIISVALTMITKNVCSGQDLMSFSKPNIVIINADDLGYGDLSCYGATMVATPNIDKLAKQGRMFTDAHSASAVCTPSRYSLLTGNYSFRSGISKPIFLKDTLIIDTQQLTIAGMLRNTGYTTACIGKWHLGFGNEYPVDWNKELKPGPLELGFDYYYGIPVVNSHPPFVYVENHHVIGYKPDDPFIYGIEAETKTYPAKLGINQIGGAKSAHALYDDEMIGTNLTNKAIEWMRTQKERPFFLYLATTNIHHPFTPARQFRYSSEAGIYGDFIHELDWMVGEILSTLDEMKVTENTLVIFTSDNGGMLNLAGQEAWERGHRQNGYLLGFKFDAWEGGHRIPLVAQWPGIIPEATRSDHLICNVDILATIAAIIDYELKPEDARDSYNILESLTGSTEKQQREHLILSPSSPRHITLRKGKWLYISAQGNGGFQSKLGQITFGGPMALLFTKQVNSDIKNGKIKDDAPPAQLYNLETDPCQTTNVYKNYPEVVEEMTTTLSKLFKSYRTAPLR